MMPDMSTLMLFSLAAIVLAISPGPDMVLIASRSAAHGKLAGLGTWSGIAVGTYCHALAAAFGLSELFLAVPVAYDIVRYVGAAYLLYLAYKAVTSKDKPDVSVREDQRGGNIWAMFMQGLLTNLLNPKMAIFVLALFPQFVSPAHGPIATQILIFATLFNLIGLVINGVVIVMASNISRFMRPQKWMQKAARYSLGVVFAGLSARLILDDRS